MRKLTIETLDSRCLHHSTAIEGPRAERPGTGLLAVREDTQMRKIVSFVAVVAALSFGCGEDDTDNSMDPSTGNTTGGTNGTSSGSTTGATTGAVTGGTTGADDAGAGPFVCERAQIPPALDQYKGTLTMTQTQYMACQTLCMTSTDPNCFNETNCPGIEAFDDCLSANLFACTAATGGTCRTPYEDAVCCVREAQCPATDASCPATNCPTELMALQTCAVADDACIQTAGNSCLLAGRVLGAPTLTPKTLKISDQSLLRALHTLSH